MPLKILIACQQHEWIQPSSLGEPLLVDSPESYLGSEGFNMLLLYWTIMANTCFLDPNINLFNTTVLRRAKIQHEIWAGLLMNRQVVFVYWSNKCMLGPCFFPPNFISSVFFMVVISILLFKTVFQWLLYANIDFKWQHWLQVMGVKINPRQKVWNRCLPLIYRKKHTMIKYTFSLKKKKTY